jgi:hypothetical protein
MSARGDLIIAMNVLHFTPGALDPANARRRASAAHVALASGSGEFQASCLYLAPGGEIAVEPTSQARLLLVVNGKASASFPSPNRLCLQVLAGIGLLLEPGEECQLASETGSVILSLEAEQLAADECGISRPERVMGHQWPNFESN